MPKLIESIDAQTVVQSIVTIMVVSAVTYLAVTGREITEALLAIASAIIGYWFGSSSVKAVQAVARSLTKE